jgi:hypothetical protein
MAQVQAATSPNLGVKLADTNATNQVTRVNESMRIIDALCQAVVKDKDLATPPGSPAEGDAYIVAASPTGAWAGKAKYVAVYVNAAWYLVLPKKGWKVYVQDESKDYEYDSSNWVEKTSTVTTAPTYTVSTKTANFTASLSEAALYLIDASSGAITVTLPAASSMGSRAFMFKRIDSSANAVIIDANSTETIDGELTLELSSQYDSVILASSGSAIYIF